MDEVPKYTIFEKKISDEAIIDDLLSGNRLTQISFSYKTETIIQFMYYCLNYFFKGKTYGEKILNIELYNKNLSYLFKFKILLPYIFKIILKYLSLTDKWFNFIFNGLELINLFHFLELKKYKSYDYNSLIYYLLDVKYKLVDTQQNSNKGIIYSNWFNVFIDGVSDIITELLVINNQLLKRPKEKIFLLLGLNDKKYIFCEICKNFPVNSIYFKCGHYFCYYCYFYNSKIIYSHKNINNEICFLCRNKLTNN